MQDIPLPLNQPQVVDQQDQALNRIQITVGDITKLPVDAIVNAANEQLAGGSGVDGAIHHAAGPELLAYTQQHHPDGCPTGLAKITPSFNLAQTHAQTINHIIHTVGPVWQPADVYPGTTDQEKLGYRHEDNQLAFCYMNCLKLASDPQHHINHLAFPCISTGVYGFPKDRAAKIALGHVLSYLRQNQTQNNRPSQITFCCFSQDDADLYQQTIQSRDQWMFNRKRS